MNIREKLGKERIYIDGGFGTMLQARGLMAGELCENWNITHPEIITDIHLEYLSAGCDIVTTNTFGANILKFNSEQLDRIIKAAVENAKNAIKKSEKQDKYVALDIGPTGKLLKPLGELDFEDAVEIFAKTVRLGVKYGADLILIETMNDSYETKAAVLAAKENSSLPVFVTNAYDESLKLMTGATPAAMCAMLEGLRVDAIGINCSLGPEQMLPVVEELINCSSLPVIVSPNAGLPTLKDGKTAYDLTAEEFGEHMRTIAKKGASLMGGCCGTTPEYIRMLKEKTKDIPYIPVEKKHDTVISSYTHSISFEERPILIGERINPTGKAAFKAALRENNIDYILNEGISQQDLGADVLDVNVGLPEIDEPKMLCEVIGELQAVCNLPLQIDTTDPEAMEQALRIYNGKPLINSVNGKREFMDKIFPLAAKYGGVVIALTIDEDGIPETAEKRFEIAQKIIAEASKYGIDKKDIIVDPLAMTVSSDPTSALVTLEVLKRLKANGIKSSLGVSNVSFGLPNRPVINSTFFALALQSGLSAAIMNPHSKEMNDVYYGFLALTNKDLRFEKYIEYSSKSTEDKKTAQSTSQKAELPPEENLKKCIVKGLKEEAAATTEVLLKTTDSLEIINNCIIPALNEIGTAFEKKTAFLPQLLMSAETAKAAFDIIKNSLLQSGENRKKKMKTVIATVKGDIHDIGKNIVKTLLENYDFDVIDLGKDVAPELIVKTVTESNAPLVGLSALMTTTVPAMAETIKQLREADCDCKIVVGGAVLTKEYADMIGADKYAKDAMETVRYAEVIYQGLGE